MEKRICVLCGDEFEPKSSRRTMCYKDHYHACPVCGKPVLTDSLRHINTCCSKECSLKSAQQNASRYWQTHPEALSAKQAKIEQTNLERYGSKNPMGDLTIRERQHNNLKKVMSENAEEIQRKRQATNLERYGVIHPMQSEDVKSKVEATCMRLYGEKSTLHLPDVEAKTKATLLSKYGVDNPAKSEIVRDKMTNTCVDRYGVPYPSTMCPEIKSKVKTTMMERYGVEHPMHSSDILQRALDHRQETMSDPIKREDILSRTKASQEKLYGGWGMASPILADKACKTMERLYGAKYYTMSDVGKKKVAESNIAKFGVAVSTKNAAVRAKLKQTLLSKQSPQVQSFKENPIAFIQELPEYKRTEPMLASILGVTPSTISVFVCRNNLQGYLVNTYSSMENTVCSWLDDWGIKYIRCSKSVIPPLELDIYIPSHNIAIECNPTATHNSSFKTPWGTEPKPYMYHKNKSIACRDIGIFLFHIFGYEMNARPDVIKSMLRNALGCTESKIYGRDTYVVELSAEESMRFLNEHHRQGGTNASIRLGLKHKMTNKLVAVMTFNKVRSTIGESDDEGEILELSRFCNQINTTVVGAASKLFKYFKQHYSFDKVISFSDIAHTKGDLYSVLGFRQVNESKPSYVWVSLKGASYFNRVSCQKKNLPNLFPDVTAEDVANHTEKEIMMNHGFAQVFDSGTIRWEFTNS